DFDQIRRGIRSQAKMNRSCAGRCIARGCRLMVILGTALGHHLDACSDAIPIALGSLKLEFQPMVVAWALIDPNLRRSIDCTHDYVDTPIPVQVTDGRSPMAGGGA